MKMIMFDFRESEKEFFDNNVFNDFEIEFIKEPLNELSVLTDKQLKETDIISVFITSSLTEEILKRFKNLRIIATRSTGYDHIDLKYCTQNNIAVFNVENYGENAVAQYTFMLITALIRNFIPAYFDVQKNLINHPNYEGRNLNKLKIGIMGCGSIGSAVAKIANFFGMKIFVCDYEINPEIKSFVEYATPDKIYQECDIVTMHLPYTNETHHIINDTAFEKMKDGVYIINTARGELIDIIALYNNIVSGKVKGAALDVVECENFSETDTQLNINEKNAKCLTKALAVQKMLGKENVIITPHIAYNTKESVETILKSMFNSIRDFSKGLHTNQIT